MQKCQQKCQEINISDITLQNMTKQRFTLRGTRTCSNVWIEILTFSGSLIIQPAWCYTFVSFWGVIDCLCLYSMFKHNSISLICSYRFSPTRWGSMAEWHGEKNLQVSRARSWGFMARFTPSAVLQAGGGFVNPLLNGDAIGARSVPLVGEIRVEKIQRAALLTSALHQEVAHLPSAQGN